MKDINENYKVTANALFEMGTFAISDIERGSTLSREGVGKVLRALVDKNILKKTAERGTNVRYKLARTHPAIRFLYESVDQMSITDFARVWDVGKGSAKNIIKQFVDDGTLEKIGTPPQKIIYTRAVQLDESIFSFEQKKAIEKYYMHTTPDGRLLLGMRGFLYWAEHKSGREDITALAQEYVDVRSKYYDRKKGVLMIDATEKLTSIFGEDISIEKLFHRDFDALPVFGKTKLSQLVRIAKSGQTKKALMSDIVDRIQESIDSIIGQYNIECIGFVPPTVARKTQLMTYLKNHLDTPCKNIKISKVKSLAPVQQKSLKKVEDRILNAQKTIIVNDTEQCRSILLIDDVTGSGATLNETAKKIVQQGIAQKVYAFTITGSAKAGIFDIISEA